MHIQPENQNLKGDGIFAGRFYSNSHFYNYRSRWEEMCLISNKGPFQWQERNWSFVRGCYNYLFDVLLNAVK